MWFATAPRNEINAYMDRYETYELCILWESNYPGSGAHWRDSRAEISKTLLRRDIDPLYCSDPSADKVNLANKKVMEAERKAKQACDTAKRAYKSCQLSDSSYCSKPNC